MSVQLGENGCAVAGDFEGSRSARRDFHAGSLCFKQGLRTEGPGLVVSTLAVFDLEIHDSAPLFLFFR